MAHKSSLQTEVERLKAEIAAIKAAQSRAAKIPLEIIVDEKMGQTEEGEIQKAIEASGLPADHVDIFVNHMFYPEPQIMDRDEELPPELKLIADETEERRRKEAEEFTRNTKPRRRITPPEERPQPLDYPKGYMGGW